MVDIAPLDLVKSTPLRCFVEQAQDQVVRYLQIFLPKPVKGKYKNNQFERLLNVANRGRQKYSLKQQICKSH